MSCTPRRWRCRSRMMVVDVVRFSPIYSFHLNVSWYAFNFSLFGFCSLQVDGDLEATDLMILFFSCVSQQEKI
jgi:hypothetical protein